MEEIIYVVFNKEENRPVISFGNFGNMVCFSSLGNAKAFIAQQKYKYPDRNFYEIKECIFTLK